jgi:hypothetical protein
MEYAMVPNLSVGLYEVKSNGPTLFHKYSMEYTVEYSTVLTRLYIVERLFHYKWSQKKKLPSLQKMWNLFFAAIPGRNYENRYCRGGAIHPRGFVRLL